MKRHAANRFRGIVRKALWIGLILLACISITAWIFLYASNSVNPELADAIYELPFQQGTAHEVVQGYGGLFSHSHQAALDFEMPIGTGVYAAREGQVYAYKDNSNEGGPWPKYQHSANYIIIRHPDGSFGCYWHLQHQGVVVRSGQVRKGQLIGYSGNTGFSLRPHLHFSVKKRLSYDKDAYVQTRFRTSEGVMILRRGRMYRAGLRRKSKSVKNTTKPLKTTLPTGYPLLALHQKQRQ